MDTICTYNDTRDEVLIAYLYNDIEPAARTAFDAHLASCAICRLELDELAIVRGQLARWSPPQTAGAPMDVEWFGRPEKPRPVSVWKRLGEIPAWAQVAAAMLFLGISAAVANLDVTYNSNGLTVRTGWHTTAKPAAQPVSVQEQPSAAWRADLAALEQQLRTEMRVPAPAPAAASAVDQEALLRRVRALIGESEQKQQRELALRIAEVDGHVQAQRFADLRNIERSLTAFRSNTGNDMLRLFNMTNELAVRVAQTR
jgi:hypothetical protein